MLIKSIFSFVRREVVFCVAAFCALVSSFFVPPSIAYFGYIDFDTLFILFALMGVIAALRECGVFDSLARILCKAVRSVRSLCLVIVLLCFFTSMFITNDVALLTFVPFSIALLGSCADGKTVMCAVILETVAANTGSMLTPLGNPQNLFLFSKMSLGVIEFMGKISMYSLASLFILLVMLFFFPKKNVSTDHESFESEKTSLKLLLVRETVYALLFVLCLLCVVRIVPKWIAAVSVFAILLVMDRKVLRSVDYMLLLTFTAFFVFTGNIASISAVRSFLENAVSGNEFAVSVFCSQFISNVPAALLLYPFSSDVESLLVGVNAGGLGTLVASLASLISFKLYAASREKLHLPSSGFYLLVFTIVNAGTLFILCALRFFLKIVVY